MRTWVGVLLLQLSCNKDGREDCEKAAARLVRIHDAHDQTTVVGPNMLAPLPADFVAATVTQCLHDPFARYDPMLRCAIDSRTDAVAAACIDEVVHRTGKPGGPRASNPQLDVRPVAPPKP